MNGLQRGKKETNKQKGPGKMDHHFSFSDKGFLSLVPFLHKIHKF